jgi:hypothetical protein
LIRVDEFRRNGVACRDLAANVAKHEWRRELLRMAQCWERAAQERLELLWSHPELRIYEDSPFVVALFPGRTIPGRP